MKQKLFMNILKVIVVIMMVLGIAAKHLFHSELLEDISFYAVALGFVVFLLIDGSKGEKD